MNAIKELIQQIEDKNLNLDDFEDDLSDCEEILNDILHSKKEYKYSDLKKDVPKSHQLHDMRRIHEVCQKFEHKT